MYNATKWLDKVVDVDSGEVIQAGTDQSAAHFNNMESGITDASVAAAMLLIAAGELQSQTEIERHVVRQVSGQGLQLRSVQPAGRRSDRKYQLRHRTRALRGQGRRLAPEH